MKISVLATEVVHLLCEKGMTLSTAESCTGGGIGYALTAVPGSSTVYLGGVVSYSNKVKNELLSVPQNILSQFGAVSEQTAAAMAVGVRNLIGADVSVSVTGIAGPASDDTHKPVGLVYIAISVNDKMCVEENHFIGNREEVRSQTIYTALKKLLDLLHDV